MIARPSRSSCVTWKSCATAPAGTSASGSIACGGCAVEGGFDIDGLGSFRHVLVAPGHPGLSVPAELADNPRTVHAYETHDYADRIAVVGAGMAAATEWLNALAAGAEVVSVRRREPLRRPLNVPRPLFSRRGLAAFHASGRLERTAVLTHLGEPSYPAGREWDEPVEAAEREGRFRVAESVDGEVQVICATGFHRGFDRDPLLRRLVEEHELETDAGRIVLAPEATVPTRRRRLSDARALGCPCPVGISGRGHSRGHEVRCATLPAKSQGMSYTLRGRLRASSPPPRASRSSQRASSQSPFTDGGRSSSWGQWSAAGLVLDMVYDRYLPYQPGWTAVPLGLLELGATMGLVLLLDIPAPLRPALWFFAGSWLVAQLLAHAGFPLL